VALRKIVSGGQTGADRAALDSARSWGVPIGGWVPAGRLAEDGAIPSGFVELKETASHNPEERTAANVRDSDGTLIISYGTLTGGSALTLEVAQKLGKPVLHLDLELLSARAAISAACRWIACSGVECLNVAGPRASEDARVYSATCMILAGVLARLRDLDAR
jgi:hypothetical protein